MNIEEIFTEYGISYATEGQNKHSRHGWIQIQECPFCGDSGYHLGVPLNGKVVNCYKCSSHKITDFLQLVRIPKKVWFGQDSIEDTPTCKESLPVEPLPKPLGPLTDQARKYLTKRRFSPSYVEAKYKAQSSLLGSPHPYRIVVPTECGWIARATHKEAPKRYINAHNAPFKSGLYNLQNVIGDWIVVVEGIFDVWRMQQNAVALYGCSVSERQKLILSKYKKVILCLDNDDAGIEAEDKLEGSLGLMTKVIRIPKSIFGLKKDPGDFEEEQLIGYRKFLQGATA